MTVPQALQHRCSLEDIVFDSSFSVGYHVSVCITMLIYTGYCHACVLYALLCSTISRCTQERILPAIEFATGPRICPTSHLLSSLTMFLGCQGVAMCKGPICFGCKGGSLGSKKCFVVASRHTLLCVIQRAVCVRTPNRGNDSQPRLNLRHMCGDIVVQHVVHSFTDICKCSIGR